VKNISYVILALMLSGCGGPLLKVKSHSPIPKATHGELDQDYRDCQWQMEKALAESGNYAVHDNHKAHKVAVCMRSKGWETHYDTPCGKENC
jgi:hypothetical protein